MCSLCSWNFLLAKNECWNKILCFSLSNLSNIPSSTGFQGASTTWTSLALLAENCRRSFGHWAADIPDNVDYWSNFSKVVEIHRRKTEAVITQFKVQFARHGIPEVLISNNGPEFDNQEFKNFSTDWQFEHQNFRSKISTSEWKGRKCCEDLKRTALDSKGRQTRLIIGNPLLAQHPKWGTQHLTSTKADGSAHAHLATNCWKVTPAKQ